MNYLEILGIFESDIKYCWRECEDALTDYVGLDWTEDQFVDLVLQNLESKPFKWDNPTEKICEAMLEAAKEIADRHGVRFSYINDGISTKIWCQPLVN